MLGRVHAIRVTRVLTQVRVTFDFGTWNFEVSITAQQASDLLDLLSAL